MRDGDFEVLLGLLGRLSAGQRARLRQALTAADGGPEVVGLVEAGAGEAPGCPHCGSVAAGAQRWGRASGLQRWRCRACGRTFNALTGTSLARLRHKAQWLRYGEALAAGMSVRQAADRCGVHRTTSFRWRHRFLRAPAAARETLSGIVEADETFFRASYKGSHVWWRGPGVPGRGPKRRGTRARLAGLSIEQVPVLIARDRAGATLGAVLEDRSIEALDGALGHALPADAVLCSDAHKAMAAVARRHQIRHEPVNLAQGERIRDGVWHVQNVNAYHSRLKTWMGRFKGVASRHLPSYLAWRHTLERAPAPANPVIWLCNAVQRPRLNT
jgi:transposase-like protein